MARISRRGAASALFAACIVLGSILHPREAEAQDTEVVSLEFASQFLNCYRPENLASAECRPVWAEIEERQSAELQSGVPASAGVEFDGTRVDCSYVALNNNGYLFEAINMMDYRSAETGQYVPLPAQRFATIEEAYNFAVSHDIWAKLLAYYPRLQACNDE